MYKSIYTYLTLQLVGDGSHLQAPAAFGHCLISKYLNLI
jgi:hypothetical protein